MRSDSHFPYTVMNWILHDTINSNCLSPYAPEPHGLARNTSISTTKIYCRRKGHEDIVDCKVGDSDALLDLESHLVVVKSWGNAT